MQILYYSPNCNNCVTLMTNHNLSKFKVIDVGVHDFPSYVTEVPTIVVNNNMYVGANAELYLQDNVSIDPFEFKMNNNQNSGGFSYIDDDSCKYTEQKNFYEIE